MHRHVGPRVNWSYPIPAFKIESRNRSVLLPCGGRCLRTIASRAEVEGLMNAPRVVPKSKFLKRCVAIISVALMSPVAAPAMTIECRDLAFGQHVSKLSVAMD